MRMIGMSVLAVLASFAFAVQSSANSQAYCELFAKDIADGRTTDVDLWQISYRSAFNDCINQYTAAAPAAAPKKALAETSRSALGDAGNVRESSCSC